MAEKSEKSPEEMTVAELRERASELEITGRSSMSKDELLQSVRDAEEQTAMIEANGSGGTSEDDFSEWEAPAEASNGSGGGAEGSGGEEDSGGERDSSGGEEDASDIPAPSIGPNTTIEHIPPEERLDMDKISSVDAMGLDKRRQVGGKRYGASPAKQAAVYGGALAVITALVIGGIILTNELDKPPPEGEVEPAPWAGNDLKPPAPIDFPRSTEQ
jgi:hypothetical protein